MENIIAVKVDINNNVVGNFEITSNILDKCKIDLYEGSTTSFFDGEYVYTPMVTSQIIACNQKTMRDNVLLKPIRTVETVDSTGGTNFEIFNGE